MRTQSKQGHHQIFKGTKTQMKKRQIILLGSALLIVLSAVGLASYFAQQRTPPVANKPVQLIRTVKTTAVNYKDINTTVQAFGRVKTSQTLDLISEVGGRMVEGTVRLKSGSNFRKGQLIYSIDDQEASLNLKSQKSNFMRDLASILPDIKLDFPSSYEKWQGFFNEISLDQDIPALPAVTVDKEKTFLATKGIFSTYYAIRSAEVRLDKYKYYAPFDGSIAEVLLQSGSFVNPGSRIANVMRSGAHELQVNVETSDIAWISEGSPATIFSTESNRQWQGVVTRISDYVNQNTQSIDVFIAINSNGAKIFDGQFLKAEIPAETIKDGMRIPRDVIYNGSEVFVVNDTLLKVHQVDIYRLTDNEAIVGGLPVGADLVIEPLINAYNNMRVDKTDVSEINMENKSNDGGRLAADASMTASN